MTDCQHENLACIACGEQIEPQCEHRYKIVRFFQDDTPAQIIKTGLTLEQAQAHCKREDTQGPGWFDGYTEESRG